MHCSVGETEPRQLTFIVFSFLILSVLLKWLLFSNTYNEENSDDLPKNFFTLLQYLSSLSSRQDIQETCSLGNFRVVLSEHLI